MNEEYISNPKKAKLLGNKAPLIDTIDINDNKINLANILMDDRFRGILIDFFRGAW
jgi:hypothetical protein